MYIISSNFSSRRLDQESTQKKVLQTKNNANGIVRSKETLNGE